MKTTRVKCEWCETDYDIPTKEHNRKKKLKTGFFCSRSCVAHYRNANLPKDFWEKQYKRTKSKFDIKNMAGSRLDEYSPFRWFLRKSKLRDVEKGRECDLDLQFLKELWESQSGKCAYTKLPMVLPKTTLEFDRIKSLPTRVSLDRIDSSKGYVKGNVEFVCLAINYAKSTFSKKQMESFIQDILGVNQSQPT